MCFFFFSSRRRHTRYWRDWSSDVCSSDLLGVVLVVALWRRGPLPMPAPEPRRGEQLQLFDAELEMAGAPNGERVLVGEQRSEERRVGKECRCRGEPYE